MNQQIDQEELDRLARVGEPDRFKYISGTGKLIWQAQAGMQQDLFELSNHPDYLCDEILLGGLRGPGKGGSLTGLESTVCTPHGMKSMRDIDVGSLVNNPDGSVATVIATFPQGERDCFRFTFSDGASTIVTDDHLWLARRTCRPLKADRRYFPFGEEDRVPYKIWTTKQLIRLLDEQSTRAWDQGKSNILIPLSEPVEFTAGAWHKWGSRIEVDPYVLGLLLGDGCLRDRYRIQFASMDPEIIAELRRRTGLDLRQNDRSRPCNHSASGASGFNEKLKGIGVFGKLAQDKSIPELYRVAPMSVRRELLQGLMDTDGSSDTRDGQCTYCSVSKQLAEDVQYLARSLGYRAKMRQKAAGYRKPDGELVECRTAYELQIQGQNTADLFKLKRKRDLCRDEFNGGTAVPRRRIENIEYVGKREAKCIAVDHPNQLYLTNDFIVTHNTDALLAWMAEPVINPRYRGIILRFSGEALKEMIERADYLYSQMGAVKSNRPPEFHFPSGAIIYTAHLRDERSFEDMRGHEYHRIGLEEATQIARRDLYLKALSSNRSTVPGLQPKTLLTTNPDGPGADWIKKRFIKVYSGGKLLAPRTPFRDPIEKRVRVFIPGVRTENRILLDNDPTYYDRLMGLPEALKRAWIEGDWDAPASQVFSEFRPHGPLLTDGGMEPDEARHVVPARALPPWCHRWAAMDWGYSHHSAAYWGCHAPDKRVHVYREMVVNKMGSDILGAEFAKRSLPDLEGLPEHHMTLYLSHDAFSARDRTKTIAEQIQRGIETILGPGSTFLLALNERERELERTNPDAALNSLVQRHEMVSGRASITIRRCNPDRVAGWSYLRTLFRWKAIEDPVTPDLAFAGRLFQEDNGYFRYQAYMDMFKGQKPEVLPGIWIHDCCPVLIETIPKLITDPKNLEDVLKFDSTDDSVGDDPAESLRFLALAFHDHEVKVPYPVWVGQQVEKFLPAGCADINLKNQIAMAAEDRYRKENSQQSTLLLPRAALGMRGR